MFKQMTELLMQKINGKPEWVRAPRLLKPYEYADVIAIRDHDLGLLRATNINWVTDDWHTEASFEWGYQGAGPCYFAMNILMHFTDQDLAFSERHYIEFRDTFVSTLRRPGGRIKKEDIFHFITEKRSMDRLGPVEVCE